MPYHERHQLPWSVWTSLIAGGLSAGAAGRP